MKRSIVLGWIGLCLATALPASAEPQSEARAAAQGAGPVAAEGEPAREPRPAVAAPGPCAEPRAAVDARTGDDFSVVGPVAALFDPIDVAAAPGIEGDAGLRMPNPIARPMTRPGACDQPGSGCGAPQPTGIVVEPPPGGGDLPAPGLR
ncbi:MAG: hypothetical protein U0900_07100 [Myxococcota bacterium]